MGCFNSQGFISNIPIEYTDECVAIVCIDTNRSKDLNEYGLYYPCSSNIYPISGPLFGTYNDYGQLENVVETPTFKLFKKVFDMPFASKLEENTVQNMIAHNSNITLSTICDRTDEQEYQELILQPFFSKFPNYLGLDVKNYSLTILFEHVDIFKTMQTKISNEFLPKNITAFDFLLSDNKNNIQKFDITLSNQFAAFYVYSLYKYYTDGDITKYRNDIFDLLKLNLGMYMLHQYYRPSSEPGQSIHYNELINLNTQILKLAKQKYDETKEY